MKGVVLIFAIMAVFCLASASKVVHLSASDFEEKTSDAKV